MRYLAFLVMILAPASGCMLVFDDRDDDVCLLAAAEDEAAAVPAPQRNPETLRCESFGGGGVCIPECGPCPAVDLAPEVSWGFCGSSCEQLTQTECEKDASCRVVKDACGIAGTCTNDFLGCFPTDQIVDTTIDCFTARDGFSCSRSPACTAYHRKIVTTLGPPEPEKLFAVCAPEGKSPGRCSGQVVCARPAPSCPIDSKPGIADGCYTGACIPVDVCEVAPQP